MAEALAPTTPRGAASEPLQDVSTPTQTACADVAALLGIDITRMVKAVAVISESQADAKAPVVKHFILFLLRGDHDLNEIKAGKIDGVKDFRLASEGEIVEYLGCKPGFIGPVGVSDKVRIIADRTVAAMSDFVCGANKEGFHLRGVNFGRDLPEPSLVADVRNVVEGDPSPDGKGTLVIKRGIEVGHIFQLGKKYSEALKCTALGEDGKPFTVTMGCYGIGVTRVVASAIEQNYDEKGIIWPDAIAPFQIALVPMNLAKSERTREAGNRLYDELTAAGYDVLLDDRNERPGVKFSDIELIGIPHRIVIGEKGLDAGTLEYKHRRDGESRDIPQAELLAFLAANVKR